MDTDVCLGIHYSLIKKGQKKILYTSVICPDHLGFLFVCLGFMRIRECGGEEFDVHKQVQDSVRMILFSTSNSRTLGYLTYSQQNLIAAFQKKKAQFYLMSHQSFMEIYMLQFYSTVTNMTSWPSLIFYQGATWQWKG